MGRKKKESKLLRVINSALARIRSRDIYFYVGIWELKVDDKTRILERVYEVSESLYSSQCGPK